ncbi:MAG: helix-turn-helix transcriptional regulator [Victivallales bacterium]|nr:helix-turn-helix transcriptional regulator [Victivallales bacterium]
MPWPIEDAWNQHLDNMNRRVHSRQYTVSLVQVEEPNSGNSSHTEHVHPYWQMELSEHAGFTVRCGTVEHMPDENDFLLIPPQNLHHFSYLHGKNAWSVKFAVAELEERYPIAILPRTHTSELLYHTLKAALMMPCNQEPEATQILIEHLLGAVIDLYFYARACDGNENVLIRKVRKFVESCDAQRRCPSVKEIAGYCACSTVFLNRVFRRYLGVPVKVFVDQYRFETARKLLLFSKLNITEVAVEMGFDDVFRFSRFFKRLSGSSPSEYKRLNLS